MAEAPAPSTATVCPRSRSKSIISQVWARRSAGSARTKSGIHHSPVPSWPVASTSLRAASTSPVDSVTSRQRPPSSSRPGAIAVAATPLRTGSASTRRYHFK